MQRLEMEKSKSKCITSFRRIKKNYIRKPLYLKNTLLFLAKKLKLIEEKENLGGNEKMLTKQIK